MIITSLFNIIILFLRGQDHLTPLPSLVPTRHALPTSHPKYLSVSINNAKFTGKQHNSMKENFLTKWIFSLIFSKSMPAFGELCSFSNQPDVLTICRCIFHTANFKKPSYSSDEKLRKGYFGMRRGFRWQYREESAAKNFPLFVLS